MQQFDTLFSIESIFLGEWGVCEWRQCSSLILSSLESIFLGEWASRGNAAV
jgi:hypothetical protein